MGLSKLYELTVHLSSEFIAHCYEFLIHIKYESAHIKKEA